MVRNVRRYLHGLDRGRVTGADGTIGCRPDRSDDGNAVRSLDGDHRTARINRALECPIALDAHDIADLVDAEQGGHARHQILAKSSRRAEHVIVIGREGYDLRRENCGQRAAVRHVLTTEYAADRFQARRVRRDFARRLREHGDIDLRAGNCSRTGDAL
jgi:hypothetical protein